MKIILYYTIAFSFLLVFISCSGQSQNNDMPEKNHKYTNLLIKETSPYLLQHAHNPVEWHAWNEETLAKAKAEDKLLLISIGYAACHWCHVMEHESFEDSAVAAIMNENFICIKVDREERPDVDAIYMDACQLITGRGGWPLNAIALPDGRPIYALTYAPKTEWNKVLKYFGNFYPAKKTEAISQAEQLTQGIVDKENIPLSTEEPLFTENELKLTWSTWKDKIDYKKGGRTGSPKFPMSYNYDYLMQDYFHTKDPQKLEAVTVTLDNMMMGGIYDQVGGGFARYSTDANWKVPHFEKMMYDNGQLVSTYAKAYALTKNEEYATVVRESIEWVKREMTDKSNGFYSSLDADSEGEEGLFYIWTNDELDNILGDDAKLLKYYWSVSLTGNWEGQNILFATKTLAKFAKLNKMEIPELQGKIKKGKAKLLKAREDRIRPGLDDKILVSWNALMLTGLIDAYRYLGDDEYLDLALKNANFIKDNTIQKDFRINRNYKNGSSTINGFLDDYSLTIEAFIALYEVTFDEEWLNLANNLSQYVLTHFYDESNSMFFYTSDIDVKLITRKKEVQDNVIPASNSSMAKSLFLLGDFYDNKLYKEISESMLNNMMQYVLNYGTYYANWAKLLDMQVHQPYEIAIVGKNAESLRKEMMSKYIPNAIYMGGKTEGSLTLLKDKLQKGDTYIYVCQNKACKMPVKTSIEALKLMAK
jgi:uncharacterized protein YyaL (SSP411 family)